MNKITNEKLPDVQKSQTGFYKKQIEKVGVRGINNYIPILLRNGDTQVVYATLSSYCSLDEYSKGINMSRITRTINDCISNNINIKNGFKNLESVVKILAENHNSPDVYIKASFNLILNNTSPMSDLYSQEPIKVTIESIYKNDEYKTFLTVKSTEMSLCPCSKEMSKLTNNITKDELEELKNLSTNLQDKISKSGFGAHNQKSHISIKVELLNKHNENEICWIEDLVDIIKKSASCPTFSVLKRADEKMVTELSYMGGYYDDDKNFNKIDNTGPKFVEDIGRDCACALDDIMNNKILDYVIIVENDESIHSNEIKAVSILTAGKNLK